MFAFLLTLLILDAIILSVVVLLQAGQGGGLASLGGAGGTDTVMGGRQAVTILTKATWWCGGIFLVLASCSRWSREREHERPPGTAAGLLAGRARSECSAAAGRIHDCATTRVDGPHHPVSGTSRLQGRGTISRDQEAVTQGNSGVTG